MARQAKLPFDVSDLSGISPLELRFIGFYCTETNFDEIIAWKKTYVMKARNMTETEIRLEALDLLNKRDIKIAVQRFVDSVMAPWQDKLQYQLLSVLRKRASYSVKDFYHDDHSPKKLSEIPEEALICIDSVVTDYKGKNADVAATTLKIGDRNTAIKMLQDLLKKKEDIDESAGDVSHEARSRVRDIFYGVEKGIELSNMAQKAPKPREEPKLAIEHQEGVDIVPMGVVEPQTEEIYVETDRLVRKAEDIVRKEIGGIGMKEHPLIKQARETARLLKGK
jgi:hypothetical protein